MSVMPKQCLFVTRRVSTPSRDAGLWALESTSASMTTPSLYLLRSSSLHQMHLLAYFHLNSQLYSIISVQQALGCRQPAASWQTSVLECRKGFPFLPYL